MPEFLLSLVRIFWPDGSPHSPDGAVSQSQDSLDAKSALSHEQPRAAVVSLGVSHTDVATSTAATVSDTARDFSSILPLSYCIVSVKRLKRTSDAILGRLTLLVDGRSVYSCDTLENLEKAIDAGEYEAKIDLSPHLGYRCPHLAVPQRDRLADGDAGIRLHIANYPDQLEGCIAVGTIDNDTLDNSKLAFDSLVSLLPQSFRVSIYD